MNRKEFKIYKRKSIRATRQILAEGKSESLSEAAFPAYSNPNPLISFLFWERLYRVLLYLENKKKFHSVMDFGCGSGVMLPLLAEKAEKVIGVDLDLAPLQKFKKHIPFQENITFQKNARSIPEGSLDLILALDVLEHVDDLDKELRNFAALLSPGGEIIISGPTENFFYKFGRFLAGPTYSGDYHLRNIYDIQKTSARYLKTEKLTTLFSPFPFFVIYTASTYEKSKIS